MSKSNRKYLPPIPSKAKKPSKGGKKSKPTAPSDAPAEDLSPAMQAGLAAAAEATDTAPETLPSAQPDPRASQNWMPVGGRRKGAGKIGAVIALLQRPEGATIQEVMEATGWQQHTVRSSITHGIAKVRGYQVVSNKPQNGARIYKIVNDAAE